MKFVRERTYRAFVACLITGLGLSVTAEAANYYVRAGQSGNGSSWSAAAANPSSAPSGSTVYVAGGTYSSWILDGKTNVTVLRATAADHGVDTGWQASFDSQVIVGSGSGTGCIQIRNGAGHVTVDGR